MHVSSATFKTWLASSAWLLASLGFTAHAAEPGVIESEIRIGQSAAQTGPAAEVLTEGLRCAGRGVTREPLVTALQAMNDYNMGNFAVTHGPKDHEGSSYTDLTIVGRGGKLVR